MSERRASEQEGQRWRFERERDRRAIYIERITDAVLEDEGWPTLTEGEQARFQHRAGVAVDAFLPDLVERDDLLQKLWARAQAAQARTAALEEALDEIQERTKGTERTLTTLAGYESGDEELRTRARGDVSWIGARARQALANPSVTEKR